MSSPQRLIVIAGQEGSGKTTTSRALLDVTPDAARIDAEDLAQVNPWQMDDAFIGLLHRNVADLTRNYWAAGYPNVIAGSFLSNHQDFERFMRRLGSSPDIVIIHLCASKAVRDQRRIDRPKPSTREWRDMVDRADPEDTTFQAHQGDYRYLRLDNDTLTLAESLARIQATFPDIYDRRVGPRHPLLAG